MNTITITKEITVSDEEINDLVDAGLNGIGYWVDSISVEEDFNAAEQTDYEFTSECLTHGYLLKIVDEDDEAHDLTKDIFVQGLKKYIEENPSFEIDQHDSVECDNIIQFALFGKLVYA